MCWLKRGAQDSVKREKRGSQTQGKGHPQKKIRKICLKSEIVAEMKQDGEYKKPENLL